MTTAPPAPGPAEHLAATLRGVASRAAENQPAGVVVSLLLALLTQLFVQLADLLERIKAGEYQIHPPAPPPAPSPSPVLQRFPPAPHQAPSNSAPPATTQVARKIRPAARGGAPGERSVRATAHPAPGPADCGPDGSRPGPETKNAPLGPRSVAAPPAGRNDCPPPPPQPKKPPPRAGALARPFRCLFATIAGEGGRTL